MDDIKCYVGQKNFNLHIRFYKGGTAMITNSDKLSSVTQVSVMQPLISWKKIIDKKCNDELKKRVTFRWPL